MGEAMNYVSKPVWCNDCYCRVRYVFMYFVIGGYGTWTGHDPKCPRRRKSPKDAEESK